MVRVAPFFDSQCITDSEVPKDWKMAKCSVVTVSKCFLPVGFGRFCRKNLDLGFWFGLGFHDKRVVNFFMTRVIWHDFHQR